MTVKRGDFIHLKEPMKTFLKKKKLFKLKLKQWIHDFIGISEIKTKLHNMDGDIMCLIEKQMNPLVSLPVDPPECDEASPYSYVRTLGVDVSKYKWWVIWYGGFAGPFEEKQQADKYVEYHKIKDNQFCTIEKLCPIPFEEVKK